MELLKIFEKPLAVGDVVKIHQHLKGKDMGTYGKFNIDKLSPTMITVYDHKLGKVIKFNATSKRGIGDASNLMIVESPTVKNFADPDYAPGAMEREGDARSALKKREAATRAAIPEIAKAVGGEAFDFKIGDDTWTGIKGIPAVTKAGKEISLGIKWDSFNRCLSLAIEDSNLPSKFVDREKGTIIAGIIAHAADDAGIDSFWAQPRSESSSDMVTRIGLPHSFIAEQAIPFIKDIIKLIKRY